MLNLKHSNHPFHSIFPRKVPHNHNERNEIDTYTVALSSSMAARTTLFIVCERQGLAVFNGVHQLMVPEPNKKLGQPFKKQRGLVNGGGTKYVHKHVPPEAVCVEEHAHELLHVGLHIGPHSNLGRGSAALVMMVTAAEPVPHYAAHECVLRVFQAVRKGRYNHAEAALDLVHAGS